MVRKMVQRIVVVISVRLVVVERAGQHFHG